MFNLLPPQTADAPSIPGSGMPTAAVHAFAPTGDHPVAPEPMPEPVAPDDVPFAEYGSIIAGSVSKERTSETRTFETESGPRRFEIYTDGRRNAELWNQLSTAMMHGYAMEGAARLTGQTFKGESIAYPLADGSIKRIEVKDPAYLGLVKVFTLVAKRPGWGWKEALIMGSELGRAFVDVCNWAATANGVTEDYLRKLEDLEKNAASRSPSVG